MSINQKRCKKCGQTKEISFFRKKSGTKYYYNKCLECDRERLRKIYHSPKKVSYRNSAEYKLKKKMIDRSPQRIAYFNDPKNKLRKKLYDSTPKIKEQHKNYEKSDRAKNIRKKYRKSIERQIARHRYDHSEKGQKTKKRLYDQLRLSPKGKILYALRRRLRLVLKLKGIRKCARTLDLLGCSVPFFKKYLESKFLLNMSWDNYGLKGWHIDHIAPIATFDLFNSEQQRKCFHYTNLQPLWADENLKKGKKICV